MFPVKDTVPRRDFPYITWMIILINGMVFLFEISLPEDSLKQLFYLFGVVPARYSHPDWAVLFGLPLDDYWPFITNMFLHGGWIHIIGNMWMLYLFGDNVEDRMGHGRFLVFYLLSGIAASITYFIFDMHSTVPAIGASGAIAGVMGAYLVMFPTARVITLIPIFFLPFFIEIPAFLYLGVWFASQVFSGTFSLLAPEAGGGIAWWAHIGGFIAGMVLLPVFRKKKRSYRKYFPDEIYSNLYK
ncbi:FIG056164: rhomboid family serine protease [hydrothermal vent metagenome]|uniref:FIG056164: rhomboid family serine protease n=1 Tax=hydrothermal vent metagenome TaxID=652676 RepID=A0A3B1CW79_9ZZZZ